VKGKYTKQQQLLLHIGEKMKDRSRHREALTARYIDDELKFGKSTTSATLCQLKAQGLVKCRRIHIDSYCKPVASYRLTPEGVKAVARLTKPVKQATLPVRPSLDLAAVRAELSAIRERTMALDAMLEQAMA
jgi:DNA-binding PadR family transcriptional regulator